MVPETSLVIAVAAAVLLFILFVGSVLWFRKRLLRRIDRYKSGDIIWVREKFLISRKAILSKWDSTTFHYLPDDSYNLKIKKWSFLVRNESFEERQLNS
jgi:hypothetical protein